MKETDNYVYNYLFLVKLVFGKMRETPQYPDSDQLAQDFHFIYDPNKPRSLIILKNSKKFKILDEGGNFGGDQKNQRQKFNFIFCNDQEE